MSKKIKISIDRPEVSSEEIASRRNYESVLAMAGAVSIPFFKKPWFWVVSVTLITVGIVAVSLLNTNVPEKKSPEEKVVSHLKKETMIDSVSGEQTQVTTHDRNEIISTSGKTKLDITFTSYKVNASKGKTITHFSGSIITIPSNCFVDKNGNKISGEVEIRYREFRDAYDIMIAGVTMKYDSAGKRHDLQSAGMMEIRGYQNGEPVSLAKGKCILVQLTSDISDPNYNLYKLNEGKNVWEYKGDEEMVSQNQNMSTRTREKVEQVVPVDVPASFADENVVANPNWLNTAQGPVGVDYMEPVKPKRVNKKNYNFVLNLGTQSSQYLNGWQGYRFEVESSEKQFDSRFYKMIWRNLNVIGGDSNRNYRFMFIGGTMSDTEDSEYIPNLIVKVYPVYDEKDSAKVMAKYNTQYKKYKEYNRAYKEQKEQELQEAIDNKNNQNPQNHSTNLVYRTFTIEGFGFWNCDQIYRIANPKYVNVRLSDALGSSPRFKSVQVIDKKVRGCFWYTLNSGATTITFNNPEDIVIIGILENGDISYVSSKMFSGLNLSKSEVPIQMTTHKMNFKTIKELKDFLYGL